MVNYVAILVTAIVGYVIGMLWYSPLLFGKQWMKLSGLTDKDMAAAKARGMAKAYVGMFITLLVMTFVLEMFIDYAGAATFAAGAILGFWVWLGFLGTTQLGMVFWQNKPFTLYLLNTAHYLVALAVMGGILAVWV